MNDAQVDQHAVRLLHDAAWKDVCDNAALFVFANHPQSGYQQTPEHDTFIRQYIGNGVF
jgi:hypothetical protein